MDEIHLVVNMALRVITLIYAAMFIYRYSKENWRATPEGRHLMSFTSVIFAFMAYAVFSTVIALSDEQPPSTDGAYPGRTLIATVLFGFTAWSMWKRNHLLTMAQKERRDLDQAASERVRSGD